MEKINKPKSLYHKIILVQILSIFFFVYAYGQKSKIALTSNLGYDQYKNWNLDAGSNISENINLSVNLGFFGNTNIRKSIFFRYGISLNKSFRSFLYCFNYPPPETPQTFNYYTKYEIYRNRDITFITTPIALGLKTKNLNFFIGIQSFLTTKINDSDSEVRLYNFASNIPEIKEEANQNHIFRLEEFIGVEYSKWEKISLSLTLYNSHNSNNFDSIAPKFRIMTGMNYYLF